MPNPRIAEISRLLYRSEGHDRKPYAPSGMTKRVKKQKTSISTQSVDFKAPHSAKTKQAWRYPGGRIFRAPSTRLGSAVYTDPKDPDEPRRKQESNFFITINSNKSAETPELMDLGVRRMKQMLEALSDESALAVYLKFGPKDPASYAADKYADVIHSVEWKAAVETGDVMKRLHAHVWLTVTYYSQIQINVQMLQHLARKAFNGDLPLGHALRIHELPYVHVKLLPQSDWTGVMRQYIHKGMLAATISD